MMSGQRSSQGHPSSQLDGVNSILQSRSDKDWNYSRISLVCRPLSDLDSPYVLWLEDVDVASQEGRAQLQSLTREVAWGERHSDELGFLEIISLRVNRAIIDAPDAFKHQTRHPVVRVARRDLLLEQGVTRAFWYEVTEVIGDEFDNR